jgi:hypothetical protein
MINPSTACNAVIGMTIPVTYAELGKLWHFSKPLEAIMNADCLRQVGFEHVSNKAVLTWKATVTLDVMSYTPYGKKTIRRPSAPLGAMKLLLLH